MSGASNSRREKAAAARNQAQAGEKRRERTVRIVGAITVLVVVVGIVVGAVLVKQSEQAANEVVVTEPDANAPLPAGVLGASDTHSFGVPFGTASADAPVLEVWEDFQCPACGALEEVNGAGIADLAEAGTIQLIWRPTAFLDPNLGNDSSNRAIAAWGCAIDAGKTREFHEVVFANQPAEEGTGYTNEQLLSWGSEVGLTGPELDTFTQCVTDGTYRAWAANSTQAFYDNGIQGTPFVVLNGSVLENAVAADPAALEKAISEAAAK